MHPHRQFVLFLRWEGLTQEEVKAKTPEQFRQWKDKHRHERCVTVQSLMQIAQSDSEQAGSRCSFRSLILSVVPHFSMSQKRR